MHREHKVKRGNQQDAVVGCGLVELRRSSTRPQPTTAYTPSRKLHVVGHGLIFLMMGIMMPETCSDRKFDNKHRISCILLVLSLHLTDLLLCVVTVCVLRRV